MCNYANALVEEFNNVAKNVCRGLGNAPAHNSCNVLSYMWLAWDNYNIIIMKFKT